MTLGHAGRVEGKGKFFCRGSPSSGATSRRISDLGERRELLSAGEFLAAHIKSSSLPQPLLRCQPRSLII